jgi:hypothetical protein
VSGAHSHRKLLERFVRQYGGFDGEWIEENFTWSGGLLALARSEPFACFEWLALREQGRMRILGICSVPDTPHLSLATLEADGFRIEVLPHGGVVPADPAGLRYWIAELVSAHEVHLRECAHVLPDIWHVLVERVLRKAPATQIDQS